MTPIFVRASFFLFQLKICKSLVLRSICNTLNALNYITETKWVWQNKNCTFLVKLYFELKSKTPVKWGVNTQAWKKRVNAFECVICLCFFSVHVFERIAFISMAHKLNVTSLIFLQNRIVRNRDQTLERMACLWYQSKW